MRNKWRGNIAAAMRASVAILQSGRRFVIESTTGISRRRKAKTLLGLAAAHYNHFLSTDVPDALELALIYTQEAILLTLKEDSWLPSALYLFAYIHFERYKRLGDVGDLDISLEHYIQAVVLLPRGHSDLPAVLTECGVVLIHRFEHLSELADLNLAVDYSTMAMALTAQSHPDAHYRLGLLGSTLHHRFQHLGEPIDLEYAIQFKTRALWFTPRDDPSLYIIVGDIGLPFLTRFEYFGELADLDAALDYMMTGVLLTPPDQPTTLSVLINIALSLQLRFERLGDLVDLDESILYVNLVVSGLPQGHALIPMRYNDLGYLLRSRFQRLGELVDLEKAIQYGIQAIELTPHAHSHMPIALDNLRYSLQCRFDYQGELADLDKAVEYGSQAVSLTDQGHPWMHIRLSNLGTTLQSRFSRLGELADLEKACECGIQALTLIPPGHPDIPILLSNLGFLAQERFTRLGQLSDLDQAIDYGTRAISSTPQGHPIMPGLLSNLAWSYVNRSKQPGMTDDINQALDFYQKSADCSTGAAAIKLQSALRWARLCSNHCISSLFQAYQRVMDLLPQHVWLGSAVESRYRTIVDVGDVSTEAAAAAIDMGDYPLALEWLEEGRSIVWKQMLQLRTPFDDLFVVAPTLAAELKQVARNLDDASSPQSVNFVASKDALALEQAAQEHHRLAEKWQELVNKTRDLPGFGSFLRPREASELRRAAHSGPVVVINTHKTRCNALIIRPGITEILHIPLDFPYEKASKTRIQLNGIVCGRDATGRYFIKDKQRPKDAFGSILKSLWTAVVKPILTALNLLQMSSASDLPHVTWCTTGLLSFLPIHAAGDYNSGDVIFNYVVSSYTPTLGALLSPPLASATFSGILAVGQSSSPGMARLPGTVNELNRIQERFQGLAITRLDEKLATPAAVLAGIEGHSWVHLACHAMQNPKKPIDSAFYLHGGTLDLAAITQKQLKNADLAFLSACQTATGDASLSEEAVHLAAGMLMAGYRTVIATMWSIGDKDAPLVAEKVYEHLLEGGTPDARRAAMAAHKATACLREKVGVKAFEEWVPYIHIGL